MKTKLLALSAAFMLSAQIQKAQVSAYTFSQMAGSYGSAVTGAFIGLPLQDDDVNTVTLPFTFSFNGSAYSSVDVCANGYIGFSGLTGTDYPPISDATTSLVISAFGTDLLMTSLIQGDIAIGSPSITNCTSVIGYSIGDVLFDWNSDFSSNPTIINIVGNTIVLNQNALNTVSPYDVLNMSGYIKQSVSGVSPNQICEFEFHKFSRFFTPDESLDFKIRLYETSNKIEIVYGTMVSSTSGFGSPEVGLKGNSNTDYNSRSVISSVNNWSNSTASTSNSDFCDFDPITFPVSGQIYQWTPVTCTVPVLAVAPSTTVSCSGSSVVLNASGATTYSWVNGPATAQNTVAPSSTTTYTLVGANTTCTSSLTYTQQVAQLPSIQVSTNNSLVCIGQTVSLTAVGASSYTWNGVAGSSLNIVSPTANTSYTVVGSNGTCTATQMISQAVSNCTGIDGATIAADRLYTAFPNPFTNVINVENTSGRILQVSVTDAIGRIVYSSSINDLSIEKINTESLQRGVYLVSLKGDGISETKRFVKD